MSVKEAAQLLAEQFVTETLKPIDYLVYDHESLTALGLTRETCEHFESGWKPKGLLSGRLAIACHDARGNLVGYVGRAVKRGQEPILTFPKNLDQDVLFNEHRIEPGKDLWVADDPLRVLVAYQHDIQAVSFLGRITPSNLRRLADLIERLQLTGVALL